MPDQYYPPIDYTSRDWRAFRSDMLEAAQSILPEWTSRSPSDFGLVLIESFAYAADILSFYTDRVANEAFLRTATQRRSVLDIANMLNYVPAKGTAAKATLQFTTQADVGEVLIPKCTRVSTQSGSAIVYYELDEDLTIDTATITQGTVEATEGQIYELEGIGVSDGTASQRYPLSHSPVIAGSTQVFVDEGGGSLRWREVDTLLEGDVADSIVSLSEDELGRTIVRFGDGITGRIPSINAVIKATYRVGGGIRGNVPATTLTKLINSVPGVLSVTNPAAGTGGTDPESLASIRENAPRAQRTSQRAVTLRDHADLALTQSVVAKANAVKAGDFTATNRHVLVYVAPFTASALAVGVLAEVEAFLDSRAVLGSVIDVQNATFIGIDIAATIYIEDGYLAATVTNTVNDALLTLLAYDSVGISGRVSLSSVYRVILGIEGVNYVDITALDATDNRNGVNVVDVVMGDDEVPIPGTFTLTPNGGI